MSDPKLYRAADGTWVFEHNDTVMFLASDPNNQHTPDPLLMLSSWLAAPPSAAFPQQERSDLLEDIKDACQEITRLRRIIAGELSEDQ